MRVLYDLALVVPKANPPDGFAIYEIILSQRHEIAAQSHGRLVVTLHSVLFWRDGARVVFGARHSKAQPGKLPLHARFISSRIGFCDLALWGFEYQSRF